MSESSAEVFSWDAWVARLHRYASGLVACLELDLTAIAATGIALEAESRVALTVKGDLPVPPAKDGNASAKPDVEPPFEFWRKDETVVQDWLNQPPELCRPLLLIAQFGCGKSVMLARFALTLAGQLKAWCESANRTEAVPPVPFPVRLREWSGEGQLWEYMVGRAQVHINPATLPSDRLTEKDLTELVERGRLLPLFDGFDELPDFSRRGTTVTDTRADAVKSILRNRYFGNRHVLSSRPDHGAEAGGYTRVGTIHSLRELDEEAAEDFVRRRLSIGSGDRSHPLLVRYRKARAAMGEWFRRPLFLAAWCARSPGWDARPEPDVMPTTVSGLMEVVLEYVLDKRLSDHRSGAAADHRSLTRKLLDNRHRLGAVLAIHADVGFGQPVDHAKLSVELGNHPHAFSAAARDDGDDNLWWYVDVALKAGLLFRRSGQTYVHRIPVTEYLVGCYYAWLAGARPAESAVARQRQLAATFQRRIWWPDHAEVWTHAFEAMWGGDESQRRLAANLVRWLLGLSKACAETAGPHDPKGQPDLDREPFSTHGFVLRALLPAEDTPAAGSPLAAGLIEQAWEQCRVATTRNWRQLNRSDRSLEPVARRHPRRVTKWLLESLEDKSFSSDHRGSIAGTIAHVAAHLRPEEVPTLRRFLDDDDYQPAWYGIRYAIGVAAKSLDTSAEKDLVNYLNEKDYRSPWSWLANAMDDVANHLDGAALTQLFVYLSKKDAKKPTQVANVPDTRDEPMHAGHPISTIGGRSEMVSKAVWPGIFRAILELRSDTNRGLAATNQLMGHLSDKAYEAAVSGIAFALFRAITHIDRAAGTGFTDLLSDDRYQFLLREVTYRLTWTIALFDRDLGERLANHLDRNEINSFWISILGSLESIVPYFRTLDMIDLRRRWANKSDKYRNLLLGEIDPQRLRESNTNEEELRDIVFDILARLDSEWAAKLKSFREYGQLDTANELIEIVTRKTLRLIGWICNTETIDERSSHEYISAQNFIVLLFETDDEKIENSKLEQAIRYLSEAKYQTLWYTITSALGSFAGNSEIGELLKLRANEALVRGEVALAHRIAGAVPGLIWFVRDVRPLAEPGNRIIWNATERDDPNLLLPIKFAPPEVLRMLAHSTGNPQELTNKPIFKRILDAVRRVLGAANAAALANKMEAVAALSRYLNGKGKAIDLIEKSLGGAGKSLRLTPPPPAEPEVPRKKKPDLVVDGDLLETALASNDALVRDLYDAAKIREEDMPFRDRDHVGGVFVCRDCGMVHNPTRIQDLETGHTEGWFFFRPPSCLGCRRKFPKDRVPDPMPEEYRWCHHCDTGYDATLLKGKTTCFSKECDATDAAARTLRMNPRRTPKRKA